MYGGWGNKVTGVAEKDRVVIEAAISSFSVSNGLFICAITRERKVVENGGSNG